MASTTTAAACNAMRQPSASTARDASSSPAADPTNCIDVRRPKRVPQCAALLRLPTIAPRMDALKDPLQPSPRPQARTRCPGDVANVVDASDTARRTRLTTSGDRTPHRSTLRAASGDADAEMAMPIVIGQATSEICKPKSCWMGTASSAGRTRAAELTKIAKATATTALDPAHAAPPMDGSRPADGSGRMGCDATNAERTVPYSAACA